MNVKKRVVIYALSLSLFLGSSSFIMADHHAKKEKKCSKKCSKLTTKLWNIANIIGGAASMWLATAGIKKIASDEQAGPLDKVAPLDTVKKYTWQGNRHDAVWSSLALYPLSAYVIIQSLRELAG